MAKVRVNDVSPDERYKQVGEFLECVQNLKQKNEIINFFVGLLTPSELLMVARRIYIGRRLLEKATYDEIRDEIGVGYTTIANIERWLYKGDAKQQVQRAKKIVSGKKVLERMRDKNISTSPLDKYAYHRFTKEILKKLFE
ncbi:MAG: hypothetical protein EOM19_05720 [Candidatus Moranbacteria bacterium]|nr:hypothetical protein [Candidatus Moranbacteria bacterium]